MYEIISYLLNIDIQLIQIKLNEYDYNEYYDYNYIKEVFEKLIRFKLFIENIKSNSNKDIDIIKNFLYELINSEGIKNDLISIIYNFNLIKDELN